MDARRFDTLARTLLSVPSRRGVLTGLASGLLSAVPLGLGREDAETRKKRKKKKKKKNNNKNPVSPPPTRQVVTRTFSNATPIEIPANRNVQPYPSSIEVSGFSNGVITNVNVSLNGLGHTIVSDVDVLLAVPHLSGRNAILLSDVSIGETVINVNLVLDDQAAAPLPAAGQLSSGTFQPANYGEGDIFPPDAPSPTGNTLLSTFNGQNPNGIWQLWVVDDGPDDLGVGSVAGGWALQISAEVDG